MSAAAWRMLTPCAACPFNKSGAGLELRRSLRRGRWRGILADLRAGKHFTCHKTSTETGNGTNRLCAGAIAWQAERGLSSDLQQIMERLDRLQERTA